MSGTSSARKVAASIARHGEWMTLKRVDEVDLPIKGKRILGGAGSSELAASADNQTFRVKIAPTELLASTWEDKAPIDSDSIVIDDLERTIKNAHPIKDCGVFIAWILEVAGG